MYSKKNIILLIFLILSSFSFAQKYSSFVDTKIGSKGEGLACGYNFIGAAYPFGMVQFTPTFFSAHKGFVITQLNGAGCSNMGNFPILPIKGDINSSPNDMNSFEKFKEIKTAQAGFLSLKMNENIDVELTATKRLGVSKFSFNNSEYGTLIIGSGINSSSSDKIKEAFVKVTSNNSLEGFTRGGDFCGTETDYKIYFAAEFDRPSQLNGTWKGKKISTKKTSTGKNSGAYFTFKTDDINKINYRIAISFVSIENAKENLKNEDRYNSFESYKKTLTFLKNKSKNVANFSGDFGHTIPKTVLDNLMKWLRKYFV